MFPVFWGNRLDLVAGSYFTSEQSLLDFLNMDENSESGDWQEFF